MRSNVIIVSLLMFLTVVVCGYTVIWFSQSHALKQGIIENINKINAKQKYISYESIEISGFPSTMYVSINKPKFKGRMDEILKAAGSQAAVQQWDEADDLEGRITLGISPLADYVSASITGNWLETSKFGDKTLTTQHQQSGSTSCLIRTQRGLSGLTMLWDFHKPS